MACLLERVEVVPEVDEPLGDLATLVSILLQQLVERTSFLWTFCLNLIVRVIPCTRFDLFWVADGAIAVFSASCLDHL